MTALSGTDELDGHHLCKNSCEGDGLRHAMMRQWQPQLTFVTSIRSCRLCCLQVHLYAKAGDIIRCKAENDRAFHVNGREITGYWRRWLPTMEVLAADTLSNCCLSFVLSSR